MYLKHREAACKSTDIRGNTKKCTSEHKNIYQRNEKI